MKFHGCSVVRIVLLLIAGMPAAGSEESEIAKRRIQHKQVYDSINPLNVFGKVIDQSGNAVQSAAVKVVWETAGALVGKGDERHERWVDSDLEGRWHLRIEKPSRAFVLDAKKAGYECVDIQDYNHNLLDKRLARDCPVVVRLRKKGDEVFLVQREGRTSMRSQSPHSRTNRLDFTEERPERLKPDGYEDLRVALNWSTASNSWSVTFSAPGEGAGVIAGTNLLYEAPSDGYQKEVTFGGPPWPTYIYLRSRTLPVYARVDLTYYPWKGGDTNQVMRIAYKARVNPYGERNLEYDESLKRNWRVEEELTEEAKTAIKAGRSFPKPDISQRIKAMDERAGEGS